METLTMDPELTKNVILLALGFILSIISSLIGMKIQKTISLKNEQRPLRQLLNFGKDDVVVVFPNRNEVTEAILPRTSTEDFLAMNNFISALLSIGWDKKIIMKSPNKFEEKDKIKNIVIICSPKSNKYGDQFQDKMEELYPETFKFRYNEKIVWIEDKDNAKYRSETYSQIEDYLKKGIAPEALPEQKYVDYAVVTKVNNPNNPKNKIIWIAGIRGIGTWGAAECIKKWWHRIYKDLPSGKKSTNFSALLKVHYDNSDIANVNVRRVESLK